MFGLETQKKTDLIHEMLEQMEDIYFDLRLEYLGMAREYDVAMERVEKLEAEKIYLEDILAGRGGL
ncbi:MAG TPA: hypothetical protein DHV42_05325 [Lachnospiraceae bacterium]|nr:hypothetical protein [Lachnospiraceae bacterium]